LKPVTPLAAVLLDLDGTLLDTAPDLANVTNVLRTQAGLEPLPYEFIRQYVSHGSRTVLRAAFPALDSEQLAALQRRFLELYRKHLVVQTRLFPGFAEVLDTLDAHRIPWGVVTNKPGWLTEPLLRELALYERAACVISGDTLPVSKPDPLPLLEAARRIGIAPALCLYLGDALIDAQAARGANMVGLGARYGYMGALEQPEQWPLTGWIDAPGELLAWVGLDGAASLLHAGAGADA
jgi:N-acetyl-D-muramate 6-phosphate phosphatase